MSIIQCSVCVTNVIRCREWPKREPRHITSMQHKAAQSDENPKTWLEFHFTDWHSLQTTWLFPLIRNVTTAYYMPTLRNEKNFFFHLSLVIFFFSPFYLIIICFGNVHLFLSEHMFYIYNGIFTWSFFFFSVYFLLLIFFNLFLLLLFKSLQFQLLLDFGAEFYLKKKRFSFFLFISSRTFCIAFYFHFHFFRLLFAFFFIVIPIFSSPSNLSIYLLFSLKCLYITLFVLPLFIPRKKERKKERKEKTYK